MRNIRDQRVYVAKWNGLKFCRYFGNVFDFADCFVYILNNHLFLWSPYTNKAAKNQKAHNTLIDNLFVLIILGMPNIIRICNSLSG